MEDLRADVARRRPAAGLSGGYSWSICPLLAECLDTSQKSNLVNNTQFYADAAAGNLPSLSIVTTKQLLNDPS